MDLGFAGLGFECEVLGLLSYRGRGREGLYNGSPKVLRYD